MEAVVLLLLHQQDIFMLNKRFSVPGYAITEVLVATVVLSISFIELNRAFSSINDVANSAVAMTKASNLAHATMERIMAQDFDEKGNEKGGYALSFDGVDDYVNLGDLSVIDGATQLSVSAWVKVSDLTDDGVILAKDIHGGQSQLLFWRDELGQQTGRSNTFSILVSDGSNESRIEGVTGKSNDNGWHHVAFTFSASSSTGLRLYINGVEDANSPVSTSGITALESNANSLLIGKPVTTSNKEFTGSIDEIRIWNDVRTAQEIIDNYKQRISDPYTDSNLKLYLRLNRGIGAIAFDHSSTMTHGTINGSSWINSWSTILGREGENTWSNYNDVDDFNGIPFKGSDYAGLDANSNNFSGLGGRITVIYVSLNTGTDPYTFDDSGTPTNYKKITVKVGIPGSTDSTRLDGLKSAKADQGYTLTFSPYGN